MAFPTVETIATQQFDSASTTHNVTMPATVNQGELLVMLFNCNDGDSSTPSLTKPTDWTEATSAGGVNFVTGASNEQAVCAIYWKVADGTEDSTSVNVASSESESAAVQTYRISGATSIEISSDNQESTTTPNCLSLTPSWGAKDTLWLAVSFTGDDAATLTTPPTNYTNGTTVGATGAAVNNQPAVQSSRRENNATSEDPGTMTINDSDACCSFTVGVRPGGHVYANDAATLDSGAVLQDHPTPANWADGTITMPSVVDDTGLSGQLYVIVQNADGGVASRAITVGSAGATLTDVGMVDLSSTAQASLTNLKWSWFDEPDPKDFTAPTDQGSSETTDGSGNLTLTLANSTLTTGQTGFLVLRDANNNLIGGYRLDVD